MLILTLLLTLTTVHSAGDIFANAYRPLPAGRLICSFNEKHTPIEEPSQRSIGPLTRRTAAALEQKAGIMVISPSIWHALMHYRLAFNQNSAHFGSIAHRLTAAWRHFKKEQTDQSFAQLYTTLKNNQPLLWHLFLWQLNLNADNWLCYLHTPSGMVVLIPHDYLNQRLALLPRWLPNEYTATEYAVGLSLQECERLELPTHLDETGYRRHLHRVKQQLASRELCAEKIASLFLSRRKITHQVTTTWHIHAMGHGVAHKSRHPWSHLSDKPTRQLSNSSIAGLPHALFKELLTTLNTHLSISLFHYQSCFSPRQNLAQLYAYNIYTRTDAGARLILNFPLVAGTFVDTPQPPLPPRYHQQSFARCLDLLMDTNLPEFFDRLDNPETNLKQALMAVTPPQTSDLHAIGNIPLLLAPQSTRYEPIEFFTSATNKKKPGILHLTIPSITDTKKTVIQHTRALLLSTFQIDIPLTLHAYREDEARNPGLHAPAIISIIPGNAIHSFTTLTAKHINLQSLLMHSFMQLAQQHSTKVYLIDRLTIENDLATHFSRQQSGTIFSRLFAAVTNWMVSEPLPLHTPTITLEKVIIVVHNDLLECFFLEPLTGGARTARETQFRLLSTKNKKLATPADLRKAYADAQLTLTKASMRSHNKRWHHYKTLFDRQSALYQPTGAELSPIG